MIDLSHYALLGNIAANLAESARETATTFGFHWSHFFAQIISFSIVAYLLHSRAYKPILKVLEERRQRIAESLTNVDRIKAELAETENARTNILSKANAQGNEMIAEARAAAAKVLENETQKAVSSAEQIIAKAREAAEADRDRMMLDLRREIGQLVAQTTAKVAGKSLSKADHQRLVEETNQQVAR